jgi:hypothetical protein
LWRASTVLSANGLSTPHKNYGDGPRTRGTAIHSAVEALSEGYEPASNAEYEPYIQGVRDWFRQTSPQVVGNERRIVNRTLRLTGRIDLFLLVDAQPFIVDVKTGGQAPWHAVQTALYHLLAVEDDELWGYFGPQFEHLQAMERMRTLQRAILYLPGDGTYKWRQHHDPIDAYLARAALALTLWRYDHGLLTVTDPENPDDDLRAVHTNAQAF